MSGITASTCARISSISISGTRISSASVTVCWGGGGGGTVLAVGWTGIKSLKQKRNYLRKSNCIRT